MHDACLHWRADAAAEVVTYGHIGRRAQSGLTALMYAAMNGHADFARLLLNAGADKNAKDGVRVYYPRFGSCCAPKALDTLKSVG